MCRAAGGAEGKGETGSGRRLQGGRGGVSDCRAVPGERPAARVASPSHVACQRSPPHRDGSAWPFLPLPLFT